MRPGPTALRIMAKLVAPAEVLVAESWTLRWLGNIVLLAVTWD